jgi:hypothetical protein
VKLPLRRPSRQKRTHEQTNHRAVDPYRSDRLAEGYHGHEFSHQRMMPAPLSDPGASRKQRLVFFGKTRLFESSLAGLFIPALRDGAHCISSVTGAEAAAYFRSVPPGRGYRASLYVLKPEVHGRCLGGWPTPLGETGRFLGRQAGKSQGLKGPDLSQRVTVINCPGSGAARANRIEFCGHADEGGWDATASLHG